MGGTDFCSNRHKVIHISLQMKAGRQIMSHDALSIHPYLKPSSQILTPCNTLFYGKTGTHAQLYTHSWKSLGLVGKTKENREKDYCALFCSSLQKWKESLLSLYPCLWVIPSFLTPKLYGFLWPMGH